MTRALPRAFALGAFAASIAGCGGSGGSASPGTGSTQSFARGSVALAFTNAPAGTSSSKRLQFLSPSASSVSIAVSGIAAPVVADVSASSAHCTATTDGRTCTISVTAPVGHDTVTATLYAGANATGAVLGSGSAAVTVVAATPFSAAIGVAGTVSSIAIALSKAQFTAGTAGTANVTVQALDAGGNVISGAYASPIALTNSDTTGAFTLSPASVSSSGTAVTLSYSGSGTATTDTITASSPNVAPANVSSASVAVVSGSTPGFACGTLYVDDDTAGLVKYALPLTSASTPTVLNTTDFNVWIAFDPNYNLYVTSYFGNVSAYAPPYTGTATGSYSGAGSYDPYGTLIDAQGHVYITEFENASVIELSSITGSVIDTIATPAEPYALAMDGAGDLFVGTGGGVYEVPASQLLSKRRAGGIDGKRRDFSGGGAGSTVFTTTAAVGGVAFDPSGNLIVGAGDAIYVVAPPFGAANVSATITNGVSTTFGLSVDCNGNIYSPNYGNDTITAYAKPYTAAPFATVGGSLPDASAIGP